MHKYYIVYLFSKWYKMFQTKKYDDLLVLAKVKAPNIVSKAKNTFF